MRQHHKNTRIRRVFLLTLLVTLLFSSGGYAKKARYYKPA